MVKLDREPPKTQPPAMHSSPATAAPHEEETSASCLETIIGVALIIISALAGAALFGPLGFVILPMLVLILLGAYTSGGRECTIDTVLLALNLLVNLALVQQGSGSGGGFRMGGRSTAAMIPGRHF